MSNQHSSEFEFIWQPNFTVTVPQSLGRDAMCGIHSFSVTDDPLAPTGWAASSSTPVTTSTTAPLEHSAQIRMASLSS